MDIILFALQGRLGEDLIRLGISILVLVILISIPICIIILLLKLKGRAKAIACALVSLWWPGVGLLFSKKSKLEGVGIAIMIVFLDVVLFSVGVVGLFVCGLGALIWLLIPYYHYKYVKETYDTIMKEEGEKIYEERIKELEEKIKEAEKKRTDIF